MYIHIYRKREREISHYTQNYKNEMSDHDEIQNSSRGPLQC